MSTNQKRRQRKLERKRSKRREKQRMLARWQSRGLAEQLTAAARCPILHSLATEEMQRRGMASVLLSRELPDGRVAAAVFLIDYWCLGVKDAFGRIMYRAEYNEWLEDVEERLDLVDTQPESARKLIEGAVAYASGLGLNPHPDYHRVKTIFGDLDPELAEEDFEFGDNGQPHFAAGPHDTPERCFRILSILEHACGRDGFHYTLPLSLAESAGIVDDEDDDAGEGDDEDEWEEDDEDDAWEGDDEDESEADDEDA